MFLALRPEKDALGEKAEWGKEAFSKGMGGWWGGLGELCMLNIPLKILLHKPAILNLTNF